MHSHLIPAVDDGSPDVDTSLKLIRGMLELGYENLVTTPHVLQDMYPNSPQSIGMGFDEINRNWDPRFNGERELPVRTAAEYFLDDHVIDLIEKNEGLLTIKDKMVLVEFPFIGAPIGYKEMLFQLQMKGYQPVIAHPERYTFFHRNTSVYKELKAAGSLLQCNILSFSGYYGGGIKAAAEYLAQNDLVDLLGTDLHHERHLDLLRELPFTPALKRLIDSQLINNSL